MSPRKVQVDWKIGIKQCPCGQPNHLDETHCVRCGLGFAGAQQSSAFQDETAISIRVPDSAGHLLDLLSVQSDNLQYSSQLPLPKTQRQI